MSTPFVGHRILKNVLEMIPIVLLLDDIDEIDDIEISFFRLAAFLVSLLLVESIFANAFTLDTDLPICGFVAGLIGAYRALPSAC